MQFYTGRFWWVKLRISYVFEFDLVGSKIRMTRYCSGLLYWLELPLVSGGECKRL